MAGLKDGLRTGELRLDELELMGGTIAPLFSGRAWFVDGEKSATGDGTSWDNAFLTIQEAVDASGDMTGDVVFVAPHKYTENVVIENHEGLTIKAVVPGWTTRVRASDATTKYEGTTSGYTTGGYCFLLLDRSVTIDGFCLDADGAYGGAYVGDGGAITAVASVPSSTSCNSANCTVRNCLIRSGSVGVALHGCSDNCVIENNVFSEQKGVDVAILAGTGRTNQRPIIRNNIFYAGASSTYGVDENNSATNVGTVVHDNVFAERAGGWTYAIRFQAAGVHFISGNHFMCDNLWSASATDFISGNFGANGADGTEVVTET